MSHFNNMTVIKGTAGDDLFESRRIIEPYPTVAIVGKEGNDRVIDWRLMYMPRGDDTPYNNHISPPAFSGGKGTDTYQLDVYRGYKSQELVTVPEKFPEISITFTPDGRAHIRGEADKVLMTLLPDVERLEVNFLKGDLYPDSMDDKYRVNLDQARQAFNKANVRFEGETVETPLNPIRLSLDYNGITADQGVTVTKIPGSTR